MKPLVLLLSTLILLPSSLCAQTASDSLKELKKKYASGGQKPEAIAAPGTEAPPNGPDKEMSVEDIEKLLLMSPSCRVRAEDKAEFDAVLAKKYGIVTCEVPEGVQVIVIVSKSVSPDQQVRYQGFPDRKLLGGRLFNHFLVLDFEGQTQYLDLLKYKKPSGFELSGYYDGNALVEFLTLGSFMDALKHYAGFTEAQVIEFMMADKTSYGKPCRFDGRREGSSWILTKWMDYETKVVWPAPKPNDAPRR